jgi:hypothetical protein
MMGSMENQISNYCFIHEEADANQSPEKGSDGKHISSTGGFSDKTDMEMKVFQQIVHF